MTVQSVWIGGAGSERHAADAAANALKGDGGAGSAGGSIAVLSAPPKDAAAIGGTGGAGRFGWDESSTLAKLVVIATVCNKAQFAGEVSGAAAAPDGAVAVPMGTPLPATDAKPTGADAAAAEPPQLLGDATDCGLLRFADRSVPSAQVRAAYRKVYERPFNSTDKYSLAVALLPGGGARTAGGGGAAAPPQYMLFLKGAPEIVVAKCGTFCSALTGGPLPVDEGFDAEMSVAYQAAGGSGERVIGFSYASLPLPASVAAAAAEMGAADAADALRDAASDAVDALIAKKGLTFMGLISLMDPPRDGVLEAVETW